MATLKQEKAVEVVVNGGSPTQGMRAAKYAPSVIRKPKVLTESDGYKELLEKYGLTKKLITSSLVKDIKAKPGKRVPELNLGAELLSMKKNDPTKEKPILVPVQINFITSDGTEHKTND